jgi:hypothetical protein
MEWVVGIVLVVAVVAGAMQPSEETQAVCILATCEIQLNETDTVRADSTPGAGD